MRDLIEYLMAILNIKTDSSFVVLDMQNELQDIKDIPSYQKFMRKNINYLGMEYMTGFQKFIKLTEMYKRRYAEENNKDRLSGSISTAKLLAGKVSKYKRVIEDDGIISFSQINENNKPYFTKFEISELAKIGSPIKCVRIQQSVSGSDELYERLKIQLENIVMTEALEKPKNKVNEKYIDIAKSMVNRF